MIYMRRFSLLFIALTLVAFSAPACSVTNPSLHMMSADKLPAFAQTAPARVRQAYQFTAANREVTEQVPCYCGCVNIGHTSSYDCYIADTYNADILLFDEHALNCSICVDITQEVMRMMREGKSTPEIVDYVNAAYSKLGSPTTR